MRPSSSVRIRPVSPDQSQPEQSFVEAARAVLERALAEGATVMMLAWENPSGETKCECLPGSAVLTRGFAMTLAEKWLPESDDAE